MNNEPFDKLWSSYWLDVQGTGPLTYSRYRLLMAEIYGARCSSQRILDVGCGSGVLMQLLRSRFPLADVQGIEISKEAYAAAPVELRGDIRLGDVLDLAPQMMPRPFDLVICSEVLEHVEDPGAVLEAIRGLVKPGGTLLVSVPAGMKHWSIQDETAGHLRRFEFDEFKRLLQLSGFCIENQYCWGWPVGSVYNRLISSVGPERAANSARSPLVRGVARLVRLALRVDDLFKSPKRFQLIARASRPS